MNIDLIGLLVIALIAWAAYAIIGVISMDGTIKRILFIVISVIVFLAVLQSLGLYNSGTHLNLNTHN